VGILATELERDLLGPAAACTISLTTSVKTTVRREQLPRGGREFLDAPVDDDRRGLAKALS
jgi:hypothetical protein